MTRIRDLERKADKIEKRQKEEQIDQVSAWRRFLSGDYDPENPGDERIEYWIELAENGNAAREGGEGEDVQDSEDADAGDVEDDA